MEKKYLQRRRKIIEKIVEAILQFSTLRWRKEDVENNSNNLTTFVEAYTLLHYTFLDTKKLLQKISRIFFLFPNCFWRSGKSVLKNGGKSHTREKVFNWWRGLSLENKGKKLPLFSSTQKRKNINWEGCRRRNYSQKA